MPPRAKGVTAAQVEKGTKPGRYGDGAGLYLLVRSKKSKFWLLRYTPKRGGKMREMGLGPAVGRTAVSLSAARAKALELHQAIREGRDPLDELEAAKAKADADAAKAKVAGITFREVADMYVAAHEAGWRSQKHIQLWHSTLRDYVLPAIGNLPVASVDTGAVIKIIEPVWRERTTTASRVRGRIESVLDYAKARGWFQGENPARWRGHLDNLLPSKSKVHRVEHHAALPWRDIGAFMQRLRCCFSVPSLCLQFLVLTAARSSEARCARWSEINLDHAVWTIPGTRMKGGREHRVPLSDAALFVLRKMAEFGTEGLVFPGLKAASTISGVTLAKLVDVTGGNGATVHGMRSTFRDWCGEMTNYPRELAELALAHRTFVDEAGQTVGGVVELAYRRGDQLERRRRLMADWATFCERPMVAAEVVPLRAAT
jgi:integrase